MKKLISAKKAKFLTNQDALVTTHVISKIATLIDNTIKRGEYIIYLQGFNKFNVNVRKSVISALKKEKYILNCTVKITNKYELSDICWNV